MRIAVLGAGAFGTALAIALSRAGRDVTLWGRDAAAMAEMAKHRENARRLPGAKLPDGLHLTSDLPDADITLLAVPSREIGALARQISGESALVACCKGIDRETGLGPTELIGLAHPNATTAMLSGPAFAEDLARGLPTAMTLASHDEAALSGLQQALSTPDIRLYRSLDVIGVQLGGAIKNVIALAAGMVMGAGLGESARAALISRGYAEMLRYALAQGALDITLSGLSGLGDLVLTATSQKSRNYSHGLQIGQGGSLQPTTTVEAMGTTFALARAAQESGIDMPITNAVAAVLDGRLGVAEAGAALMGRPLKAEGQ
jgi:glycerol-3-phosphate dehydrogenase (NAD(P)+)